MLEFVVGVLEMGMKIRYGQASFHIAVLRRICISRATRVAMLSVLFRLQFLESFSLRGCVSPLRGDVVSFAFALIVPFAFTASRARTITTPPFVYYVPFL